LVVAGRDELAAGAIISSIGRHAGATATASAASFDLRNVHTRTVRLIAASLGLGCSQVHTFTGVCGACGQQNLQCSSKILSCFVFVEPKACIGVTKPGIDWDSR